MRSDPQPCEHRYLTGCPHCRAREKAAAARREIPRPTPSGYFDGKTYHVGDMFDY